MFNISTQTIDKISTTPVLGTAIGGLTVLSNIIKLVADVSKIAFNSLKNSVKKSDQLSKNIQAQKNDALNHLYFIGKGIIRAIPVVGGASLWAYNIKQLKNSENASESDSASESAPASEAESAPKAAPESQS